LAQFTFGLKQKGKVGFGREELMAEPLDWLEQIWEGIKASNFAAGELVRDSTIVGLAMVIVIVVALSILGWWMFRRRHRLVLSRTRISIAGYEQVSINVWMESVSSVFAAWRPIPAVITVARSDTDRYPYASASVSTPSRESPWDVDIAFVATGNGTGKERHRILGRSTAPQDWGRSARAKLRVDVAPQSSVLGASQEACDGRTGRGAA
jgi:hypothetical protein